MHIGFIGLGKMGFNLVGNLVRHGHTVVGYDINAALVEDIKTEGAQGANTLQELYDALPEKRVLWLMIPAGPLVDNVIEQLLAVMQPGDVVIDGGNSHYQDSLRRYAYLKEKGIGFLDCGTSGGISGALNGACTMVGGDPDVIEPLHGVFSDVSVENGYLYTGPAGSGHFTKMVHNGIEYGMMQSIAEGFEVLEKSQFPFDFEAVARMWSHGSVIRAGSPGCGVGAVWAVAVAAISKDAVPSAKARARWRSLRRVVVRPVMGSIPPMSFLSD